MIRPKPMPAELYGRNARAHLAGQRWQHFPSGYTYINLYRHVEEPVILDMRRALYAAILRRLR
jgi:hypothetical protein